MVIGEPQNAFGKRHALQDVEVVRVHIVLVHSDADSEAGAQAFVEPDLPSAAAAARQLAPRDDDRGGARLVDEQSVVFKILAPDAASRTLALDHLPATRRVHPAQNPGGRNGSVWVTGVRMM